MELRDQPPATLDEPPTLAPELEGNGMPAGSAPEPPPDPPPATTKRKRANILAAILGIAVVFTLAIIGSIKVQQQSAAAPKQTPALAVLPFQNIGRMEGEDFAHAMTEEITNRLSLLHGLRVIGRHSARTYAGGTATPQQIAKSLGVTYILTGTVRWDRSPDGKVLVRVSPALLKSDDASQVWAEAYQTVLTGMFDVQAKIAMRVADAVNVAPSLSEREALEKRPTRDPRAYAFYLRGKELIDNTSSPVPLNQAIGYFQKATEADPGFAVALAALSAAHTEYFWRRADRTPGRLLLARRALEKAAALDPSNPDVHIARGIYHYHGERDLPSALREFTIAERFRPNDFTIETYKGAIARRQARWDQAIASQKRCLELEPRNGKAAIDLGLSLHFLRRFAEAESYVNRGLMLAPQESDGARLQALLAIDARNNVPEAIEHLRDAVARIQLPSAVIGVLQDLTWPALEDPSLKKLLIDATPTRETDRWRFYTSKTRLYFYLKDRARTRAYSDSAATVLHAALADTPRPWEAHDLLSVVEAMRGNGEKALASFRQARELMPAEKDAWFASQNENHLPEIFMLLGDHDSAISAMEKRVDIPGGISRNRLRLDPLYAPLRGNPRFERIIK